MTQAIEILKDGSQVCYESDDIEEYDDLVCVTDPDLPRIDLTKVKSMEIAAERINSEVMYKNTVMVTRASAKGIATAQTIASEPVTVEHSTYYVYLKFQGQRAKRKFIIDEEIADKEDELNKAIEDEEPEATINQLKSELETLEGEKKNYTENKENAGVNVLKAEETLAEKEADKKEIEEAQKEYEANLAILNDATALKEYQDAFATIEPKAIEYINAQAEVQPFDDALAEIGIDGFDANGNITGSTSGQYDYLQQLVSGAKDVADLIDDCNADIVSIQNIIEMGALNELVTLQEVQKWIWNYVTNQYEYVTVYHYVLTSGSEITAADAVAIIDAEIAALDAKIETEQAMANSYKEKLAELLGTPVEEETPAA